VIATDTSLHLFLHWRER